MVEEGVEVEVEVDGKHSDTIDAVHPLHRFSKLVIARMFLGCKSRLVGFYCKVKLQVAIRMRFN